MPHADPSHADYGHGKSSVQEGCGPVGVADGHMRPMDGDCRVTVGRGVRDDGVGAVVHAAPGGAVTTLRQRVATRERSPLPPAIF